MDLLSFPHSAYWVVKSNKRLYSGLSAATLAITETAPTVGYKLRITPSSTIGHTDMAGSITVGAEPAITLNGTTSKTTTYTNAAGTKPVITCSNIDCSLLIECLDTLGHAIQEETLTQIKIRYEPTTKSYVDASGAWAQSQSYAMVVGAIGIGEVIRYLSKDYTVKQVESFNWLDGSELYRILYF